jgi:hypothetical protein
LATLAADDEIVQFYTAGSVNFSSGIDSSTPPQELPPFKSSRPLQQRWTGGHRLLPSSSARQPQSLAAARQPRHAVGAGEGSALDGRQARSYGARLGAGQTAANSRNGEATN